MFWHSLRYLECGGRLAWLPVRQRASCVVWRPALLLKKQPSALWDTTIQ